MGVFDDPPCAHVDDGVLQERPKEGVEEGTSEADEGDVEYEGERSGEYKGGGGG